MTYMTQYCEHQAINDLLVGFVGESEKKGICLITDMVKLPEGEYGLPRSTKRGQGHGYGLTSIRAAVGTGGYGVPSQGPRQYLEFSPQGVWHSIPCGLYASKL